MDATALFESTMELIRQEGVGVFEKEDNLVRDAIARMEHTIAEDGLPYHLVREQCISGKRVDLAILGADDSILVAVEFKYEPSRARSSEFSTGKFAVVDWVGKYSVQEDVERVHDYVAQGKAKTAYAVLIDEGGHFRNRTPHPGSEWLDWDNGVSALWTKVGGDSSA